MGARGVLSVERRVRFPRSVAGCAGATRFEARCRSRTFVARGLASVCRRRRAALVASAVRARRANANLRRSSVASIRSDQFVEATGDMRVFEETFRFWKARFWPKGRKNRISSRGFRKRGHAIRTLRPRNRSQSRPRRAWPAVDGTGDWNDGMNRVGAEGKGESVWLGWFLHTILWSSRRSQMPAANQARRDVAAARDALKAALEREGWDGEWYRRAYFDDGTPLGFRAE